MVFTKTAKINNLTLVYELFGNTEQLNYSEIPNS
nr:MAG TPA: hypothetical protein [Caudoviricetes sp.]